ncbi:MAG: hypothetical protein HPY46_06560 [Candidatus Aminicenantes bacterium]|nr:hypothetical protein [Candidatus Aminicenantes bacterium]
MVQDALALLADPAREYDPFEAGIWGGAFVGLTYRTIYKGEFNPFLIISIISPGSGGFLRC